MTALPEANTAAVGSDPLILDSWEAWSGALDCGHTGRIWDAAELRSHSHSVANRPAFRQLPKGAPVILMLSNTVAFPVLLLALLQRGCNPILIFAGTPLPAVRRLADAFGVRFVVHDFIEGVSALEPTQLNVLDRVEIGPVATALLDTGVRTDPLIPMPGEGGLLHPTSGTYGAAKFCLRNQVTAMAEARSYLETFPFYREIRITFTTPLGHGYGYGFGLLAAILSHSTLAIDAVFNPKRVLRLEQEQPSDVLAIVPPMAKALLGMARRDQGTRMAPAVFYSGASIDPGLAQDFERSFRTSLHTNWGTTETGPITTSYDPSGKLPGVGRPFNGVAVRTIPGQGFEGLGDDVGELEVRSPALMQGYLPAVPAARPIEYFATGDIGTIDADGCVHLIGRIRDIVNVGGTKVDPSEVEAVIMAHGAIDDVAVYPGLREDGTEFVQAAVVGKLADDRSLRAHCIEQLDGYKVPTVFHIVDDIPRTPSGKCIKVQCPGYPESLIVKTRGS